MANELQIWALDGGGQVTPVEKQKHTKESERDLEDALVKNPEMLMPRVTLIGRQTRTDGGPLDLLGVDGKGRLVVFELKRGSLRREAVTQIIDYASSLESMSDEALVEHIVDRSGNSGIERIDNFNDWYESRFDDQDSLKPVQMTLVGLGADADAIRMVEFLANHGTPLRMLTFHGYNHDGKTLLAKHAQTERDDVKRVGPQRNWREKEETRRKALDKRIAELGIRDFWNDVVSVFEEKCYRYVRKEGLAFGWRNIKLPGGDSGSNSFLAVRLTKTGKEIRIIFLPYASRHR